MDVLKGMKIHKKNVITCYSYAIIALPYIFILFVNKIKHLIKPPEKNNFAIICYLYAIETSPFLKNLCSYLYEGGYGITDVYVDSLNRSNLSSQQGMCVVKHNSSIQNILKKYLFIDAKALYFLLLVLKFKIKRYKYVFAVDYRAIYFLGGISFPLNKVIFLSMEGTDHIRHFPLSTVLKILPKCHSYIIASKERGQEINDFLNLNLKFNYFPISQRPKTKILKPSSLIPNIIYSGYFAEWSAVEELIDIKINSTISHPSNLYLQGYSFGDDEFFEKMQNRIKSQTKITIDTAYYSDSKHHELLSGFDIGIAFYKNISGNDNFENLIFSSGKIASYLWAGLAVMTNIDCEMTKMLPFIFIKDLTTENFINGLTTFQNNKDEFRRFAYKLAQTKYNFDAYMNEIFEKNILSIEQI